MDDLDIVREIVDQIRVEAETSEAAPKVGQTYVARNQGMLITPRSIDVTVIWIDGDHVHYRREGESEVRQTPRERFAEIVDLNDIPNADSPRYSEKPTLGTDA